MIKSFIFCSLTLLLYGCSKVKRVEKKMSGTWEISNYTYQNTNGLSYEYPCSGTFEFQNCNSEYCIYSLELTYTANGIQSVKNNTGYYKLKDDAQHYELQRSNSNSTTSFLEGRIIHLNRTQLKTIFQDEFGNHLFILEKGN